MKRRTLITWSLGLPGAAALGADQEAGNDGPGGAVAIKTLQRRSQRGSLADRRERVRGDSGKWNDEATLQHAPPLERKPEGKSLDDWSEDLAVTPAVTTERDDNWLLFRTRQLDDNDRFWIERIERRGRTFTVECGEAIWQGQYSKTFTYYEVLGVNLGALPAGGYRVRWVVKPLVFERFEDPGQAKDNWPRDERPGGDEATEFDLPFVVRATP